MRRIPLPLLFLLFLALQMLGVESYYLTRRPQALIIKPTVPKTTSLKAAPGVSVIAGAVTGGLFAGGLHAIAGACFFFVLENLWLQHNTIC